MSYKHDGAFPTKAVNNEVQQPGLSKREYIATAALQGMISNAAIKLSYGKDIGNQNQKVATVAVSLADALLEALETL